MKVIEILCAYTDDTFQASYFIICLDTFCKVAVCQNSVMENVSHDVRTEVESRMKNWQSLHYYTENILYTLYY